MKRQGTVRSHRRSFLRLAAGAVALTAAPGVARALAQTSPTGEWTGDCTDEPGVQLLIDFSQGVPIPGVTLSGLTPPPGWNLYSHPSMPTSLFIPPDWIAIAGWADSYSQSGRPNWTDVRPEVPQLNLFRVLSPDEEIAFEYVVGTILGPPLRPDQVAQIGKQSLLGEEPDVRSVCTYIDTNPLSPAFMEADRFGRYVHVTSGFAVGLESAFQPATTVTINNFYGPRLDFEEITRELFLRFVVQFMGGGGDPDNGGGGDDDGGGDGGDGGDGDGPDDDGDDPDDDGDG
jgi:hypothetical protein